MPAGDGCCCVPVTRDAHGYRARLAGTWADTPPSGPHQFHRPIPWAAQRKTPMPAASFVFRYVGAAAIIAVLSIAVVLLVSPATVERSPFGTSSARQQPPTYVTAYWIEQVAAKVLPSVVTLQISERDHSLLGSGIILTADGLIMTNNHVVAELRIGPQSPARAEVTFHDGRVAAVEVVAADPESDMAIVQAHNFSGLTPISMGSSANLHVGQLVAALGSPLGLQGTVTAGIISALHRLVCPAADGDHRSGFNAIQTDAAINPGNSGGALVDMNGDLVGVNAAESVVGSADDSNITQHGSIGLGFAIPIDHAARIVAELIATGRASHAWLGAQVSDEADPYGAKVVGVESGGPAATGGLTAGAVVTKIGDQRIGSGDAMLAAVNSMEPGDLVALVFADGSGQTKSVQIKLGSDRGRQ
jgi:putative serine protease PepD